MSGRPICCCLLTLACLAGRVASAQTPRHLAAVADEGYAAQCPAPVDVTGWIHSRLAHSFHCIQQGWEYVRVEYVSHTLNHSTWSPRFTGQGNPLIGTSWQNRPLHVGWFIETIFAHVIVSGQVGQDNDFFGGYRVGWDLDPYWGTEWRLGWGSPDLDYPQTPNATRTGRVLITDLSALYYPWGDSQIRPFVQLGIGLTEIDFHDAVGVRRKEGLITMPFGVGVKHYFRRWLSWRVDLVDNLAFGRATANTMHSVSLTFAVEMHLGVRPKSYWPWQPSRHIW